MPDITFTSAVLQSFSRSTSGGVAKFTAALTSAVCKALDWEEIPDFLTGATPEGDIAASEAKLTPSDKELLKHAIVLGVQRVNKFQITRLELEGKKRKGHRLEVRFDLHFPDLKGCWKLEQYLLTVGDRKGSLTVQYAKQQKLDMPEGPKATDEQRQATMADND